MAAIEGKPVPLPARSVRPSLALMLVMLMLGGCILPFPPFWDPTLFPPFGEETVVVLNETDEDWVVVIDSAGPSGFAVPAGSSGELPLWGVPATEARLLDVNCNEADALPLDEAGSPLVLVIGGDGALATGTADAIPEDLPILAEYFECFASGAPVEPGEPVPGTAGSLLVLGEDNGLWAIDPSTAEATALVPGDPGFMTTSYALSPDGTLVAYARWDDMTANSTLLVADLDGSNPREVAENGDLPAWSPDGTLLAYLDTDPFAGGSALTIVDVDGGEPRTLAPAATWVAWSPDATRIAYIADATNDWSSEMPQPGTLFVVDVESGEVRELAETAPFASPPAWSPDGSRIAFTGGTFEVSDVRVIDAAGGEPTVVVEDSSESYSEAAWSPDGSQLAIISFSIGFLSSTSSVTIVDAAGEGDPRVLLTSPSDSYYQPTWSPDGEWLALARSGIESIASSLVLVDLESAGEVVLAEHVYNVAGWRP